MNAKSVAKNDAMLENIQNKTQKYVNLGLKYEDVMLVAFDKEAAYFNNLISRISENEEEWNWKNGKTWPQGLCKNEMQQDFNGL